jgi:hypothetical protein
MADGGPWHTAEMNRNVTFRTDESLLPDNTESVIYTWDFRDGTTTRWSVVHQFTDGGTYHVLLKVDPAVFAQAPNAELSNSPQTGWSYDIVRVQIPMPVGATGIGAASTVTLSLMTSRVS